MTEQTETPVARDGNGGQSAGDVLLKVTDLVRHFPVTRGVVFRRKVGAAVVAVRRAGAIHVFDSINHFFTIGQMIIPGSNYWNIGIGRSEGDVEGDEEGVGTMRVLGENMAWLLKRIAE